MTLTTSDEFFPSIRGLILSHTRSRKPIPLVDLQRWLVHLRVAYGAAKADVVNDSIDASVVADLIEYAGEHDIVLSLRTSCVSDPPHLKAYRDLGLFDIHLTPASLDDLDLWLHAAKAHGVGVRVQITGPPHLTVDAQKLAAEWRDASVRSVRFVLDDPLVENVPCRSTAQALTMLDDIRALAAALHEVDIDVCIDGVPFCIFPEGFRASIVNNPQRPFDHDGIIPASKRLAETLYNRSPRAISRVLKALLARDTLHQHPADNLLLPWLLDHTAAHILTGVWTRLARGWRPLRRGTASLPPSRARYELEKKATVRSRAHMNPQCVVCSLRRICDGPTETFRNAAPGIEIHALPGETVADPLHFSRHCARYFDTIDETRRTQSANKTQLAEAAQHLLLEIPPTRRVPPKDYGIENAYFERFEGGLKWFVVENGERLSTPLQTLSPPFMIAVDVGGGLAEWFGFRIGRAIRLAAPMIAYRHSFALYADEHGEYVLLRDGKPVRPAELESLRAQPLRLPERADVRLCAIDIEDVITTYNIRIWSGPERSLPTMPPKYSVIIVSTRFTRRLQAVLRCLAHQSGVDTASFEVIVAYVPGIDATDDLLDTVSAAYPALRIVRKPFPPRKEHAKGFMINEAGRSARGDWIVLLDSDTLLPPDFFARLNDAANDAEFIAPDGRKLLPPDVTAKILLGEIEPWNEWRALVDGPGEYRRREAKGVPVGFCQVFRAHWLRDIPYAEYEHFEWADMAFGKALIERTGKPHRLSGALLLHLDHDSSQWFGTPKQY